MIRHLWFDFSETIVFVNEERMWRFRYATYAEVTGKPVNDDLMAEYNALYKKFSNSNSALFHSLGLPSNF